MTIRVLITGGVGFVGSFIVDAALEQHPEWELIVFDLVFPSKQKERVRYERGSVLDVDALNAVFAEIQPYAVIHTAGLVPELAQRYTLEDEARVMSINVDGTRNMLQVAKSHGVQAFVWTSSCTAVTDNTRREYRNIDETAPTSTDSFIYGKSKVWTLYLLLDDLADRFKWKAIAEALVLKANDEKMATCALRPSVLFGEGDYQLVPSVHACIAKFETLFLIGDGLNMWDATYVGNVADAHVLAVDNLLTKQTAAGEAIFIANDEPITFRDFSLAIWAPFGHYPPFTLQSPKSAAHFAGYLAEWVTWVTGTPTTLCRGSVLDGCATRYCSGRKARDLLGYKPRVGLEEGLKRSCEEYARRLEKTQTVDEKD